VLLKKPPVAMQGRADGNFYERMSADVLLDSAKYLPAKASADGEPMTWYSLLFSGVQKQNPAGERRGSDLELDFRLMLPPLLRVWLSKCRSSA
jgi:hypothetical protein